MSKGIGNYHFKVFVSHMHYGEETGIFKDDYVAVKNAFHSYGDDHNLSYNVTDMYTGPTGPNKTKKTLLKGISRYQYFVSLIGTQFSENMGDELREAITLFNNKKINHIIILVNKTFENQFRQLLVEEYGDSAPSFVTYTNTNNVESLIREQLDKHNPVFLGSWRKPLLWVILLVGIILLGLVIKRYPLLSTKHDSDNESVPKAENVLEHAVPVPITTPKQSSRINQSSQPSHSPSSSGGTRSFSNEERLAGRKVYIRYDAKDINSNSISQRGAITAGIQTTDNPNEALWKVEVTATARKHEAGNPMGLFFAYVDAHLKITNTVTGIIQCDEDIAPPGSKVVGVKGGNANSYDGAMRDAYKTANELIVNRLSQVINE